MDSSMDSLIDTARPLTVVSQEPLLDALVQLAAVAGCELDRAPDIVAARSRWHEASLVLLDQPALEACVAARFPRRSNVILLSNVPIADPLVCTGMLGIGADRLIVLPDNETELITAFADAIDRPADQPGRMVAVLGGRGGAGASVLATAVALAALRSGADTLLVDGDQLGGGLDLILGAEIQPGLRWPDLRIQRGRVPMSALRSALPGRVARGARLAVVSCDRAGPGPTPDAMAAVIDSGLRAGNTVVCDLPRHLDPAAHTALDRASLAVLVVPAELRAIAAAHGLAVELTKAGVRLGVVARGPAPGGLNATEVANAVGVPLLTGLRADPTLPGRLEHTGLKARRGALADAARAVLTALSARPTRTVVVA